jgi:Ribbon-helix-helix protein, copG family
MFFCMRTTLDLDDELMRAVKRRAADSGKTMTEVLEDALREGLRPPSSASVGYRFEWRTVRGELRPGIDLTDRNSLFEAMEGSS